MDWLDVQKLLNELEEKYNSLYLINDYISKEENYDIDNMRVARYIYFLIKKIKKKLVSLPKSMNEVRSKCITYGNDIKKLTDELKIISDDIDEVSLGIDFVKLLVDISDKTYKFEDGYAKSIMYENYFNKLSKIIEIVNDKNLTRKQKYEYCTSFENGLSKEDKGELYVQEFIGVPNKLLESGILLKLLRENIRNNDNSYLFLEKIKLVNLEIEAYKEDVLDEETLSEKLKIYDSMECSCFVKKMKHNKIK